MPAADTKVDQDSTVKVKISSGAPAVPVPDVLRVQFEEAEKTLKAKGFQVERKLQESESTAGIVLDQNPKAGSQAKKNDVITLTVAKELSKAEVPDLLGKTREQAVKALQDAKLKLGSVTETESPAAPPKTVIQQQYPAGEQIEVNKTVNITIAKAAQQTQVPNLAQKTVAQAKDELASKGLKFGRVISGPSDDDSMVVFSDPGAGTPVNTGTEVNVMTVRGQGGNNNGGNGNNDGFIGGLGGR